MKLNKRLAGILVTTMVLSSMPQTVKAIDYENHWAAQAINKWKNKGILDGFEDGTFRPKENVTKAQFAKILVELFGYTEVEGAKTYEDVAEGKWYSDYITKISASGIMYEVGTYFNPNTSITREEAAYALVNAYKVTGQDEVNKTFNDQNQISDWALDTVENLYEAGYIKGTPEGNFNPKGSLTRAEMITMIDRINSEVINVKGAYSQDVKGNLVVNTRDVVLKDMTITGNLYLAEGIGDGDIDLENVKVEGKVFVEGGGINSIKSKNCQYAQSMQVSAKNPVRVVVEGDGVRIEALEGTQVTLTGSFTQITVSQDVQMIIKDAKVDTVVIAQGTKEGVAPKIDITQGTTVKQIQADIAAAITGTGKVGELIANASDVKIEKAPDKVTIGEKDVVINVAGKDQTQTTVDTKPSTSTDSSKNDSSSSDSDDSSDSEESLAPTYRISGVVSAQQKVGEGLKDVAEGAIIQIFELVGEKSIYIKTIYTEANGAYSVSLESGKIYQIQAWINDEDHNGYFYSNRLSPLKQNLDGYNFVLTQFPVANITVVDQNDRPIRDVKIVPVMNGKAEGWSYTGNDGNEVRYLWGNDETTFNFDFYLAGVKVQPMTDIKDIIVGEVKKEQDYRLDLKVRLPYSIPSTVTGTLVSENGEALKNYSVQLVRRKYTEDNGDKWVSQVETQTNNQGIFAFEGIDTNLASNEYYTLSVSSRDEKGNSYDTDYRNRSLYALLAQRTIKLQQTYGVIVKVVDKDGKPIKDANVKLSGFTSDGNYDYSTNTNSQGIADLHATYIEPIYNTIVVNYRNQAAVDHIQMTEGKYNYEKTIPLNNVSVGGKLATIQLEEQNVTIGDRTFRAKRVGIESTNGMYWGDVDASREATILLPEDYSEDLKLYVVGENGEVLYRDTIDIPEEKFSTTLDLNNVPRYRISGNLIVDNSSQSYKVTTGAIISVQTGANFNGTLDTLVATSESTENGYAQGNLIGSTSYTLIARYEQDGVEYIGKRTLDYHYISLQTVKDLVEDIYMTEVKKLKIKVKDTEQNALSNTVVQINNERYITDKEGYITYKDGIGQELKFHVSGRKDNGEKYTIKQIMDEANQVEVGIDSIIVQKDMDLTIIVG